MFEWGRKNQKKWIPLLGVLYFCTQSAFSYGDASPSPVSLDQFDSICGNTLNNPSAENLDATSRTQKLQYCQAAQSAKEAIHANQILWKVWAAVGAVCTAACAASLASIVYKPYVCIAGSVGAGITDGVISKNFTNAMMGIMGAGGALMANQTMNTAVKEGSTPKDIGACLSAGNAAFQTYTKYSGIDTAEKNTINNLTSAAAVTSSAASAYVSTSTDLTAPLSGGDTGSGGSLGSTSVTPSGLTAEAYKALCNNTSNTGLMIQCAVATDSSIPKFVGTPQFQNELKDATGLGLSDFLSKSTSPGRALASGLSGSSLTADQATKITAALSQMEKQIERSIPSSMYASGGGGRPRSGSGDSEIDFGGFLNGAMSQMNPKKEDSQGKNSMALITFAYQNQSANSIVENKSLSLFDRITYRYGFIDKRMLDGGNLK